MKRFNIHIAVLTLLCLSCEEFLDKNPNEEFTTLETLEEVQALLDNRITLNEAEIGVLTFVEDTYYLTEEGYNNRFLQDWQRELYLWRGNDLDDRPWKTCYQAVLYANVALDALSQLSRSTDPFLYDNTKGSALLFRSFYLLTLSQGYIKPYDPTTANSDLGLPLRLDSDSEIPIVRSSVQQTYDQIINDLKIAVSLLPEQSFVPTRPSKAAVYGVLARAFLSMGRFEEALENANNALQIKNDLMNYNELDLTADYPFTQFHEEDIFYAKSYVPFELISPFFGAMDTTLYNSYNDSDLRKEAYFGDNPFIPGTVTFTGDYSGTSGLFSESVYHGIAADELYLIRAECYARTGDVTSAMQDLNTLLETRWQTGTFVPYTASGQTDAIQQIIDERKKELIFRGQRWVDIRRLKDTEFAVRPKRIVDGQEFELSPDNPDSRYTLLIPFDAIEVDSNMQQNE